MTYSQKLKDPRWQKKRLQILERDDWACQSCLSTTTSLQVHHVVYAKLEPWEYTDECYQTLCETCHRIRQKLADRICNTIKLKLKTVATEKMQDVAQAIIGNAFDSSPEKPLPRVLSPEQGREMFKQMREAVSDGGVSK